MNARMFVGLALVASSLGCSKPAPEEIADRLWVSEMPSGPRDVVRAFVLTEVKGKAFGSFYRGSFYRGSHDSFSWRSTAKQKGEIEFLQDGRVVAVEIRSCKPDQGFEHCILMVGDPMAVGRYQSKKRWVLPRRSKSATIDVAELMLELAEDDEELEAVVEAAAAGER